MAPFAKTTGKLPIQGLKDNEGPSPDDPKSKKNGKKRQPKKEKKTVPHGIKGEQKAIPPRTKRPMVHHSIPGTVGKTKVPMAQPPVLGTAKAPKEVKKEIPPKPRTKLPLVHHSVPGTTATTKVPLPKLAVSGTAKGTQPGKDIAPSKMAWTELLKGNDPAPGPKITAPVKNSIPWKAFKPAVTVSFLPAGGFYFPPLK